MVLHVTLSGPGTELSLHLNSSGQLDMSSSNKAVRVSASSARPRAQAPVEGKEERGEQPLSEGDEGVTVIPCAGSGEERKESTTAKGGTTPNLSGTERLGTLL